MSRQYYVEVGRYGPERFECAFGAGPFRTQKRAVAVGREAFANHPAADALRVMDNGTSLVKELTKAEAAKAGRV